MNLTPVGTVKRLSEHEFAIEIAPAYREGLHGIACGDRLDVLYWMHKLDPEKRGLLKVHPRGDRSRPLKGVFGVRSPMRPNPIGVSATVVRRVEQDRLIVEPFDAEDASPIIDIKSGRAGPQPR